MGRLLNALWVCGSTCSGKSSVASALAQQYELPLYEIDAHERDHADRALAAGLATYARWTAMTLTERWALSSVDELVEDTIALSRERMPLIVDDVRGGGRPVLVAGFQPLPELVAPVLASPRQAVFLVATPRFRRETHFERPHAWGMPSQTGDRERAQTNRLDRDDRIGEEVARQARALGLKLIDVDGSRGVHEIVDEVERWFAPYLPVRP